MPAAVRRVVERIGENCEPSLCSVLYVAGAGGSLRAGVTENPVALTRSIKSLLVNVTCGGAPVYVWPGGGITVMVDVARMPANSFGSVPTPAIVSPIEFTMRLDDYRALGGHMDRVRRLDDVLAAGGWRVIGADAGVPWPLARAGGARAMSAPGAVAGRLDGDRWHFQHGPIDCIVSADGEPTRGRGGARARLGALRTACSTSSSASCRCCAPTSSRRRGAVARAARSRAAWSRRAGRTPPAAASSRRWPRSPAASPRS